MATILFVGAKSTLDTSELDERLNERRYRFLTVPGLIQKIYGRDESTGDICGIYFFEDKMRCKHIARPNSQRQFQQLMR